MIFLCQIFFNVLITFVWLNFWHSFKFEFYLFYFNFILLLIWIFSFNLKNSSCNIAKYLWKYCLKRPLLGCFWEFLDRKDCWKQTTLFFIQNFLQTWCFKLWMLNIHFFIFLYRVRVDSFVSFLQSSSVDNRVLNLRCYEFLLVVKEVYQKNFQIIII